MISQDLDDQISICSIPGLVGVIASGKLGGFYDGTVDELRATHARLAAEALVHIDEGDVDFRLTAGFTDDFVKGSCTVLEGSNFGLEPEAATIRYDFGVPCTRHHLSGMLSL